jgi:hypothetical protein
MIVQMPISDGFYVSRAMPLSSQVCINWYALENKLSTGEVLSVSLLGTPGLEQLATSGVLNQINRGGWTFKDKAYFVNGTGLYRLESDLTTLTSLGTIAGTSRVSIADNGTQMLILVPGSAGYIFTTGPDSLATITDVDFTASGNPQNVVFMDGYFVLSTDTKKFITSALNNGLSYLATDFGSAESNPDAIVAVFRHKSSLFVFGTETGEVFGNIGGASFPFQRQQGFILTKGLIAPDSISVAGDSFMYIGNGRGEGPSVWGFSGNSVIKISTPAIDELLETELENGVLSTVFSYSYAHDGSYFIAWSLANTTIVFDQNNGRWHERQSDITGTMTSWRANSLILAYGLLLAGDSIDGRIGKCDIDILTEYTETIERTVSGRPFQNQGMPFTVPFIEITMESGVGNAASAEPQIRMDRSKDGKTWTDERPRCVGKVGEYDRRIAWRQNGRASRSEIFRFKYAEPCRAVIVKVEADVRPLRA